jgi:hypothetical protein
MASSSLDPRVFRCKALLYYATELDLSPNTQSAINAGTTYTLTKLGDMMKSKFWSGTWGPQSPQPPRRSPASCDSRFHAQFFMGKVGFVVKLCTLLENIKIRIQLRTSLGYLLSVFEYAEQLCVLWTVCQLSCVYLPQLLSACIIYRTCAFALNMVPDAMLWNLKWRLLFFIPSIIVRRKTLMIFPSPLECKLNVYFFYEVCSGTIPSPKFNQTEPGPFKSISKLISKNQYLMYRYIVFLNLYPIRVVSISHTCQHRSPQPPAKRTTTGAAVQPCHHRRKTVQRVHRKTVLRVSSGTTKTVRRAPQDSLARSPPLQAVQRDCQDSRDRRHRQQRTIRSRRAHRVRHRQPSQHKPAKLCPVAGQHRLPSPRSPATVRKNHRR